MSLYIVAPNTLNIPSPAIYILKIEVIIYNKIRVYIILNSRAEVNIISKKLTDKSNLAIKIKKNLIFQGISPGKVFFLSTY
jgi:hypothetical protein